MGRYAFNAYLPPIFYNFYPLIELIRQDFSGQFCKI